MKHQYEDYIDWIDNRLEILKEPLTALEVIAFSGITNVIRASLLANKATLELHGRDACEECALWAMDETGKVERCRTLLAVTNQLDEVMG